MWIFVALCYNKAIIPDITAAVISGYIKLLYKDKYLTNILIIKEPIFWSDANVCGKYNILCVD